MGAGAGECELRGGQKGRATDGDGADGEWHATVIDVGSEYMLKAELHQYRTEPDENRVDRERIDGRCRYV
jgi:hypothetical protein